MSRTDQKECVLTRQFMKGLQSHKTSWQWQQRILASSSLSYLISFSFVNRSNCDAGTLIGTDWSPMEASHVQCYGHWQSAQLLAHQTLYWSRSEGQEHVCESEQIHPQAWENRPILRGNCHSHHFVYPRHTGVTIRSGTERGMSVTTGSFPSG